MTTTGPLEKPDAVQVARYLEGVIGGAVGLDVWSREESGLLRTDRDVCTHCGDVVKLGRQLASLHPAIHVTVYDLEKHASRAEEAGITQAPTTVVRSGGRSIRLVGLFSGMLFPALLDAIGFVSHGRSPLLDETRTALAEMDEVTIEGMVMPFDPYSAYMVRLLTSLAVESRKIKLELVELSEFPVLAGQRSVTEVPLVSINGRRFSGAWDEAPLVEQIQRVLAGNDEAVVRDRVLAAPYLSEEEAIHRAQEEMMRQQAGAPGIVPPSGGPPVEGTGGSGLIVPGR